MRSKLTDYCEQFDRAVRPLLAPLERAHDALREATAGTPGKPLEAPLGEARHHVQVLCDKVAAQQAYVLIFGPLKSGKSTLMNAVAAAYVSEVSSLPAYPCLVFVGPGDRREYQVTRYDGRSETFDDAPPLATFLERAHTALADAIRSAEQGGLSFDPQQHFPEAIRRIDVRLPDTELSQTGAVLVDTPGLYTRMRFGYDRMTRDFRDAAACAVFVVKSDTLFLEQVFAEFHELLDLFSRIFLVVNVDSTKRDVLPDGRLVPSLEQSDPEAILRAFRELAMSAPLHRAAAQGRVRMYPVDLLHAAAAVLQGRPAREQPAGFVQFRDDLADFLASDEYLASFRNDSLQRAQALVAAVLRELDGEPVAELVARHREVTSQLEDATAERDLLERALQLDLQGAFARVDRTVAAELERSARDEGQQLLRTLGASIDTWFLSGHSLHWLVADHWTPLCTDYLAEVARHGRRAVEHALDQRDAGLDLPRAVLELCHRLRIDLGAVRRAALAAIGQPPADAAARVPVDAAQLPVRRSLLDRALFRSTDALRRRLFGDLRQPTEKIPARDKAARLGEPGRLYLHQCVLRFRAELAPATSSSLQQHYGDALREATIRELHERLRQELPPVTARIERLTRERQRLAALHEPLRLLQQIAQQVGQKLPALARTFGAELPPRDAERRVVLRPRQAPDPAPRSPRAAQRPRSAD